MFIIWIFFLTSKISELFMYTTASKRPENGDGYLQKKTKAQIILCLVGLLIMKTNYLGL